MIPSRQEIAYRTYGAWLLARFDAGGARYFDESPLGALRSFFAAALVAPAYFIGKLLSISGAGLQSDADPFIVALVRSEEHTSELQSLMRNSSAVFCLKKKNHHQLIQHH